MVYIVLVLFSIVGFIAGLMLYGKSTIRQIQSGMFFGFSIGCVLVLVFEVMQ